MVNRILIGFGILIMVVGGSIYYVIDTGIIDSNNDQLIEKGVKMWGLLVAGAGTALLIIGLVKKG